MLCCDVMLGQGVATTMLRQRSAQEKMEEEKRVAGSKQVRSRKSRIRACKLVIGGSTRNQRSTLVTEQKTMLLMASENGTYLGVEF